MIYKQKNTRKIISDINMIPLLDILLILLIIFIIFPSTIIHNIEVQLPCSTNVISNINNVYPVIIEVLEVEKYNLILNNKKIKQLSSVQIMQKSRNIIDAHPNAIFFIGGNKDIIYNEIIKILNLLHQSGINSINLLTRPI